MESSVKQFVEKHYPDSKSDLFATFIIRCLELCNKDGLTGYMTPFVWMFISSYQKLRENIIDYHFVNNLIQLEYSGFDGATVPVCTFTLRNTSIENGHGSYIRLSDFKGPENQAPKTLEALENNKCGWFFYANQNGFEKIPGSPIAYWVSKTAQEVFSSSPSLKTVAYPRQGLATTNNDLFLRQWFEISNNKIGFGLNKQEAQQSSFKWFPLNKGGAFRKWFGNNQFVINFENDGKTVCDYIDNTPGVKVKSNGRIINRDKYFSEGLTWSTISSSSMSMRYSPVGSVFETKGGMCFCEDSSLLWPVLGYMNTKIVEYFLKAISPTLDFHEGPLGRLPVIVNRESTNQKIIELVKDSIAMSKDDWDSRETSWDFKCNELIKHRVRNIKSAFTNYKIEWSKKLYKLHNNEEELNRQFIKIYGLKDELTPVVPLDEITILQEESKILHGELFIDPMPVLVQLLSYSVGCLFGRYSLDKPALILANQGETLQDFLQQVPNPIFIPDEDNIIPVLDGEWFNDDIVGRFKVFLKVAFGEEHFEENLKYIEENIGKDIRKYFVKDFYNDHIKRYKKRPIYWMFSSPRGHFKALIYMHRYQPDLCSKMLNDYLQAFISKLEAAKQTQTMLSLREDISAREKTAATKDIDKLELMLKDCRDYAKTLFIIATQKISIDLDDGVKVNYQKFKEALVPIKGLEKEEE
jgi:type II restriction/modification system DNA methylase subunit YeeA